MAEGKVKWFADKKGYGFIDVDGKDIFVHFTDIAGEGFRTLKENEIVNFEIVESSKGLKAVKVQRKK